VAAPPALAAAAKPHVDARLRTIDQIVFTGNYIDSSWNTNFGYIQFATSNGSTITNLTFANNIFNNYSSLTGITFNSPAATTTISNLRIYGNRSSGDFTLPSTATITNQYITGNTCEFSGRIIRNTTRKLFDIVGDLSTTIGSAGGASALPATPTGYVNVNVDGTIRKIPYYNS
jgi:hypothetical protein